MTEITTDEGATAVITHRVRDEHQAAYERWLDEIAPLCKAWPGHLDWHIVRPIRGLTGTYTVVIRFDSEANLRGWMESQDRRKLIEKVQPLLVRGDDFFISSGLDFWFVPGGAEAKVPVRWKQFLLTWSAIYPLVLFVPMTLMPVLQGLGVPETPLVSTLILTGVIVFLMVYAVMPPLHEARSAMVVLLKRSASRHAPFDLVSGRLHPRLRVSVRSLRGTPSRASIC